MSCQNSFIWRARKEKEVKECYMTLEQQTTSLSYMVSFQKEKACMNMRTCCFVQVVLQDLMR